jgi:hypothetical protein
MPARGWQPSATVWLAAKPTSQPGQKDVGCPARASVAWSARPSRLRGACLVNPRPAVPRNQCRERVHASMADPVMARTPRKGGITPRIHCLGCGMTKNELDGRSFRRIYVTHVLSTPTESEPLLRCIHPIRGDIPAGLIACSGIKSRCIFYGLQNFCRRFRS